ncbi:hypothetical protein PAXRUDRAFT_17497 [Paxillus rubicundulus Ve08.2h10]|uniref:Uncharacterized protein n=1 Tax=Paxillus rubicundulus Ve08.2h10 TaxID=930991 RepID=A0A0D0CQ33_9AGAM|nr:hypothetical protein PAXRUDRAFT_17497 [Paxillus rubicundulus Ve08.2h10]
MKRFKIKGTSRILYQAESLQQLRESKISMDDLIKVKGTIEGSDDGTGNHEEPPNPSQLTAEDMDKLPYVSQIPLHTCHAEHENEEPQDPSQLPLHTHNGEDEVSLNPFRDSSLPQSDDNDEGGESEAAALLNLDQEDEDDTSRQTPQLIRGALHPHWVCSMLAGQLTEGTDGENEGSNDNQSDWEADDRAHKERAKNKHAQLGGSPPSAFGTEASNGGGSDAPTSHKGKAVACPCAKIEDNHCHGRIHGEGMQKAVEIGEHTVAEADKIAKEYSKQCSTILKLAGLSGSSTQSTSDWNCYQVWYASKHPKDEDVDATTYRQQMKAHFNEHKDKEQFPEIWEDVHKHALLCLADTTDLKPAQVHNLIMKCKMWETTQNILIVGAILYTGPGEAGCHASGVLSGSDILIKLAKEKKYDTEQFIDYLTTMANQSSCRHSDPPTSEPLRYSAPLHHYSAHSVNTGLNSDKGATYKLKPTSTPPPTTPDSLEDSASQQSGQWGSNLRLRCRQWGEATNAPLPNLSAAANPCEEYLLCGDWETPQDRYCHILPLIISEKHAVSIPTNQKANFSWTHTLDIMWKHQVWVVDWPAKVVPLGPGFSANGKGVTSEMLDAICMPLLKGQMDKVHYRHKELCLIRKTVTKGKGKAKGKGKEKEKEISDIPILDTEFEIVPWSDEHKRWADKQDLKMLHIPLVIDTDGTTLQYLRDSADLLSTLPKDFKMPDDPHSPSVDQSPPTPIHHCHPRHYSPSLSPSPSRSRPSTSREQNIVDRH